MPIKFGVKRPSGTAHCTTLLIKDDAYGLLEPSASLIANLIPEPTYLAVSFSKCIAPALRVSRLLVPDATSEQATRGNLQATTQMPAPLMVALVMQRFKSGVVDQIIAAIRNEAVGRQKLTGKILNGLSFAAKPNGHHIWLSLPRQWNRADFVSHVLRDGLAVVRSDAFASAAMVGTVFSFSRQRGCPAEIIMRAQCFHRDDCGQNADDLQ